MAIIQATKQYPPEKEAFEAAKADRRAPASVRIVQTGGAKPTNPVQKLGEKARGMTLKLLGRHLKNAEADIKAKIESFKAWVRETEGNLPYHEWPDLQALRDVESARTVLLEEFVRRKVLPSSVVDEARPWEIPTKQ